MIDETVEWVVEAEELVGQSKMRELNRKDDMSDEDVYKSVINGGKSQTKKFCKMERFKSAKYTQANIRHYLIMQD